MPVLATGAVFLVLSSFLASTVEMVEALTIVLAVGVSRQWRSTLIGVGAALVALAAVIAALGPALALIPIGVGAMLTTFGIFWGGEGVGVVCPGQDAAIPAIVTFVLLTALLSVRTLQRPARQPNGGRMHATA